MKSRCAKIADELDLTKRIACSSWNSQHTQTFSSILEAESTCEHAIARRVLEDIFRTQAHHPKVTSHLVCPLVKVILCMKDDRGIACRSARRMQAHTFLQRHTGQTKRIVLAQVLLGREGKFADISHTGDAVGGDACLFETLLVDRILHAACNGFLQALNLKRFDLLTGHAFVFLVKELA